jgi:spore coat polysaccharide biosynthesis protein SpsF
LRIIATIQARLSSRRLPGKVLLESAGRPMLAFLVERLKLCPSLDGLIIATSLEAEDAAIADFALAHGIACHRGSLDHVAERLMQAGQLMQADAIVRISADSPLLPPEAVEQAIALFKSGDCDLVSNTFPVRSFPKGFSVEVVRLSKLAEAVPQMLLAEDREHVTRFFYSEPARHRIASFRHHEDCSAMNLSVDTPDDLAHFRAMLVAMDRPAAAYTLDEIISLSKAVRRQP